MKEPIFDSSLTAMFKNFHLIVLKKMSEIDMNFFMNYNFRISVTFSRKNI